MPMTPQGYTRTFPAPGSSVTLPMSPAMVAQNAPAVQPDAAQAAGGANIADVQAAAAEMGAPTPPELAGAPGAAQDPQAAAQAQGAAPAGPSWQPGATGQPLYPPGEGPVTGQVPKLAMTRCDGRSLLGVYGDNSHANCVAKAFSGTATVPSRAEKSGERSVTSVEHHTNVVCCSRPISVELYAIIEKCAANTERFRREGIDVGPLLREAGQKLGEVLNTGRGGLQRSAVGESGLKIGVRPYALYGEAAWPSARSKSGRPVQDAPPKITTIGKEKMAGFLSFMTGVPDTPAAPSATPAPPSTLRKSLANAGRMSSGILNTTAGAAGTLGTGLMYGLNRLGAAAGHEKSKAIGPMYKRLLQDTAGHTAAGAKDVWNSLAHPGTAATEPSNVAKSFNAIRHRAGVGPYTRAASNFAEGAGETAWNLALANRLANTQLAQAAGQAATKVPGVSKGVGLVSKGLQKLPGVNTAAGQAGYGTAAGAALEAPTIVDAAKKQYDPVSYTTNAITESLKTMPDDLYEFVRKQPVSVRAGVIEAWQRDPEATSNLLIDWMRKGTQQQDTPEGQVKSGATADIPAGNALKPTAPIAPKAPKAVTAPTGNAPLQTPKQNIQQPSKGLINPSSQLPKPDPAPVIAANTGPKRTPGQPVTSLGNKTTPAGSQLMGPEALNARVAEIQKGQADRQKLFADGVAKAKAQQATSAQQFTDGLPQQIAEGTAPHQVQGQSPQQVALAKQVAQGLRGKYTAPQTYNTGTGFGARTPLGPNARIQSIIDRRNATAANHAGWRNSKESPGPSVGPGVTDVTVSPYDIDQGRAPAKTREGFLARKSRAYAQSPARQNHMEAMKAYHAARAAGQTAVQPPAYHAEGPTWEEYNSPAYQANTAPAPEPLAPVGEGLPAGTTDPTATVAPEAAAPEPQVSSSQLLPTDPSVLGMRVPTGAPTPGSLGLNTEATVGAEAGASAPTPGSLGLNTEATVGAEAGQAYDALKSDVLGPNPTPQQQQEVAQVETEGPSLFASTAMIAASAGLLPVTWAQELSRGGMAGIKQKTSEFVTNNAVIPFIKSNYGDQIKAMGVDPESINSADDVGKLAANAIKQKEDGLREVSEMLGTEVKSMDEAKTKLNELKSNVPAAMKAMGLDSSFLDKLSAKTGMPVQTPEQVNAALSKAEAAMENPLGTMLDSFMSKMGMGNMSGLQQIMMLLTGGGLIMGLMGMLTGNSGMKGLGSAAGLLGGAGTWASGALGGTDYLSGLLGMDPNKNKPAEALPTEPQPYPPTAAPTEPQAPTGSASRILG